MEVPSTSMVAAYLGALLLIVDLQLTHGEPLISTDQLHNHLKHVFSESRSFLQPDKKKETRRYIKHIFRSLSRLYITNVEEQYYEFMHEGDQVNGTNYLWILPGSRYGTSQDRLLLVGAHYDSQINTPGVDDNGSGMAAMLEVARKLSDLSGCNRRNSIGFVAFDWGEFNQYGSKVWLSDYFVPLLLRRLHLTPSDFQGAIILDTIMNWDDRPGTQTYPQDFDLAFPETYQRLRASDFRGNFIMLSNRLDDEDLAHGLIRTWETLPLNETYRIEQISLPVSGRTNNLPDIFDDFRRSDHYNFWNYFDPVTTTKGLKAVFLTDTGNYRGDMTQCHHSHCDALTIVDHKKLEFLAKITEMITRYAMEVATERDSAECMGFPADRWLTTTPFPSTTTTQSTPNPKPQTSSSAVTFYKKSTTSMFTLQMSTLILCVHLFKVT